MQMNRYIRIIFIVLVVIVVFTPLALNLTQRRIVNNLLSQRAKLSEELERGIRAQKVADEFKKKGLLDLKAQEEFLLAKVPPAEKNTLAVLKQLTQLASEVKIRVISIDSKSRQDTSFGNLYRFPLVLELECEYQQLCLFLDKILPMVRLVTIEELLIKREEGILPVLKVTLIISTYNTPLL